MGKNKHFPAFCFALLKFRAKIQLLCVPTLIDRKVCERASTGAQIVFCLIPHSQPAGVILSACSNLPMCVCVCVCMACAVISFSVCVCSFVQVGGSFCTHQQCCTIFFLSWYISAGVRLWPSCTDLNLQTLKQCKQDFKVY